MKRDAIEMQYLLGKLSESEAERFEQRYFADDSLFDEIETAEDDLIDAYVRDQLSAEDRKQFETNLLSSKRIAERVEFAKLFTKSAYVSPVVVEPAKLNWWARLFSYSWVPSSALSGAVAGVFLLIVLGIPGSIVWMKLRNESKRLDIERAAIEQQKQGLDQRDKQITDRESKTNNLASQVQTTREQQDRRDQQQDRRQQELESMAERLARQRPPAADSVLAFASARLVSSDGQRSSDDQLPKLIVRPSDAAINLQLVLPANKYKSFTATLESSANSNICSKNNLRPRLSGKNRIIELRCDSQLVSTGSYMVRVTPGNRSAILENTLTYQFRVLKN